MGYIEKLAATEAVKRVVGDRDIDFEIAMDLYCALNSLPDAKVAPVVYGRWVYDPNATDWGIGGYVCSECQNKNNNLPCNKVENIHFFAGSKFCPHCGAKMA